MGSIASRYRRLAFSRPKPPQDEVVALIVVFVATTQVILRVAASSNDIGFLSPRIPFGGVLDLILAFLAAGALGLIAGLLGVRIFRALKTAVSRSRR